jgi:hypothetical protein
MSRRKAIIRGLTLWQPHAWCVARAGKDVENREWALPPWMRGQYVAIHAGKTFDQEAAEVLREHGIPVPEQRAMPQSAIVAVARAVDDSTQPTGSFWWSGPHGHLLAEAVAIEPVPCSGAKGYWKLPPDVLAEVRRRWRVARAVAESCALPAELSWEPGADG